MLTIFQRFHNNWVVRPLPSHRCTFRPQNFWVLVILNVLTDALIMTIPVPILWQLRVSKLRKIGVSLLLCSGVFVISTAVVRAAFTIAGAPSVITINRWGCKYLADSVMVSRSDLRCVISRQWHFSAPFPITLCPWCFVEYLMQNGREWSGFPGLLVAKILQRFLHRPLHLLHPMFCLTQPVRETAVGMIAVNAPVVIPIFSKPFWKRGTYRPGREAAQAQGGGGGGMFGGNRRRAADGQRPTVFQIPSEMTWTTQGVSHGTSEQTELSKLSRVSRPGNITANRDLEKGPDTTSGAVEMRSAERRAEQDDDMAISPTRGVG